MFGILFVPTLKCMTLSPTQILCLKNANYLSRENKIKKMPLNSLHCGKKQSK